MQVLRGQMSILLPGDGVVISRRQAVLYHTGQFNERYVSVRLSVRRRFVRFHAAHSASRASVRMFQSNSRDALVST